MRGTDELIAELEAEAKQHWGVYLAIGFENTSIFITASEADKHRLLNEAIQLGGIPVGMIYADCDGEYLVLKSRVYPEHAEAKAEARAFLTKVCEEIRASVQTRRSA